MVLVPTVALFLGLAAIAWSDARHFRVPDTLSLPLVATGLAWSGLTGAGWQSAAGAAAGYLVFRSIEGGFERRRGYPGLGRGDAKLAAVAGAWCGIAGLPTVVLAASLGGLLFVGARRVGLLPAGEHSPYLPFAPFLCAAIGAVWLHQIASG